MLRINQIKLPLDHTPEDLTRALLAKLEIKATELIEYRIFRQAVDARKKGAIYLVYSVDAVLENEARFQQPRKSSDIMASPDLS